MDQTAGRGAAVGAQFPKTRLSDDVPAVDEDGIAALIDKARPFLDVGDGRNALKILGPVTGLWRRMARTGRLETLHEFFPSLTTDRRSGSDGRSCSEEQDRPDGSARRLAVLIVTKLDRLGRDAIDERHSSETGGLPVHCLLWAASIP